MVGDTKVELNQYKSSRTKRFQQHSSNCKDIKLQHLLFLRRREALTPIGPVEVLTAFDLAAGPHV